MMRAFARRLCPLRIMQPKPASLVKPSWLLICLNLVDQDRALVAFGSADLAIDVKLERYVIHILDSISSMKAAGQPLSSASSLSVGSLLPSFVVTWTSSPCFCWCSLDVATAESAAEEEDSEEIETAPSLVVPTSSAEMAGCDLYTLPRHQTGVESSFFGIGSQKYRTKRLL